MAERQLGVGGDFGARSQLTRSNVHILDKIPIRDVSDTSDASVGTDKYVLAGDLYVPKTNFSVSAVSGAFSTDTYLAGSGIILPDNPIVGSLYKCWFDVTKTNVGTATPIINIRIGSAGTTADTSRITFTFGAGTTAADTGIFEITAWFRTVGSGTSAVIAAWCRLTSNLTTTGLSNAVKARQTVSSGFASNAISGQQIGVSYNGGASAAHTIQQVNCEYLHAA